MIKFALGATGMGAVALALAACTPPHPHHHTDAALRAVSSLDCPATQGDLTRKSAATDGKSCDYADSEGAEVSLQLIALNGQDARTALAPLESQLDAALPAGAGASGGGGGDKDKVDIDLPGIHIHANGNDEARVNVGNLSVNGDNRTAGGSAAVSTQARPGHGGVTINAQNNGAVIRVTEPGSGVRLTVIHASDTPGPTGVKMVGYEARGPLGGPLAVASVKAKSNDHDELRDDMRDLLRLNVGG